MSLNASVRWFVIATIIAIDAVGLRLAGMRIGAAGLFRLGSALLVLLVIALTYSRLRPRERLVDLAQSGAQLLLLFAATAVLSYVAAASTVPMRDELFAWADQRLGFDWMAWFQWVQSHPALQRILHLAYISATPQLVAAVLFLALTGQSARNRELIWMLAISLLVIIPLSGVLPGAGAFVLYRVVELVDAPFVAQFDMLRSGVMSVIDLGRVEGIITFPSFHTTLAILFPYVLRGSRRVFPGAALLNGLMLLSIPSEGGHYLVDVIAGALVAAFAIWAAVRIEARIGGSLPRAALSPAE